MWPRAEECWQPREAERGMDQILPWSLQKEPALMTPSLQPVRLILDFWLPELSEDTFLLFEDTCGEVLLQPRGTDSPHHGVIETTK